MAIELKGRRFDYGENGLLVFRLRWFCDTEDEALFGITPFYRGLERKGHNGAVWDGNTSKWIVDATFKGLADGGPDPESFDDYVIDGAWREEPIESFPDRALLITEFGAYEEDGKLKFPEKIPDRKAGGSGIVGVIPFAGGTSGGTGLEPGDPNPLWNTTTYPVYYDQAEHTYVRPRVPAEVYRRRGTVVETLPAGFEYDGDAKAWLYVEPSRRKIGNAWRITERAKEVDKLKHIQALYALIQK